MRCDKKIEEYDNLVKRILSCKLDCCGKIQLSHCESCNEVNLWTYWEGGRDRLDADILVVGQDWGHIPDSISVADVLKLGGPSRDLGYRDMFYDPRITTDETLCTLFKNIKGCENVEHDYLHSGRICKNVFFTNYVCCYRKEKTSGGFDNKWMENCKKHFLDLIAIIKPKIIICLGRKAFDCVLTAAGEPKSQGCYNNTILKGAVSMSINDVTVQVYPMAHPGSMGTLNRCRSCDNDTKVISRERGIELQCNDWKKIKV